jgi:hypothetical protein
MKIFSLAALLLLLPAAALAQTSRFLWQRSIETRTGAEQAAQLIRCRTGGYLLCGVVTDSVTGRTSTYVAKLAEDGQTVWDQRIAPPPGYSYQGTSLAENRSGQILVATIGLDLTVPGLSDSDGRIDLLSPTGQPLWQQTNSSPLVDSFGALKLGNDGHFVGTMALLGTTSAFKMDSTGRYVWRNVIRLDTVNVGVVFN